MKTKFNFWKWLLGIATAAAILFTASAESVLFFWKDGEVANLGNYQRFIPIDDVDSITVEDNNTMFISPSRIEVGLFQEYFYDLTITTAEGKEVSKWDCKWSSLDTTVLRFYDGYYNWNIVAPGECDIIAEYDGMTAKVHVVVKDEDFYIECWTDTVHRDTIVVSLFDDYIGWNSRSEYSYVSCLRGDGDDMIISTDTNCATIYNYNAGICEGHIFSRSAGECDIIAKGKGKTAKLHVIVEDEDMYFSPDTLRLKIDRATKDPYNMLYRNRIDTTQLYIHDEYDSYGNYHYAWDEDFVSTNPKVATNKGGAIYAESPGECDFILTYRGREAKLHVIVDEPKVYFNKDTVRMNEFDAEYQALWLSTDGLIGSVEPDYVYTTDSSVARPYGKDCYITPVGAGECDFVALYGGKEAKCRVIVEEERVVFSKSRSIKDTLSTLTMNLNDDYPTIYAIGSKGHILSSVKFGSTNSKVAMADKGKSSDDFVLVSQGEGECSIIASTDRGKTAYLKVFVRNPLRFEKDTLRLTLDQYMIGGDISNYGFNVIYSGDTVTNSPNCLYSSSLSGMNVGNESYNGGFRIYRQFPKTPYNTNEFDITAEYASSTAKCHIIIEKRDIHFPQDTVILKLGDYYYDYLRILDENGKDYLSYGLMEFFLSSTDSSVATLYSKGNIDLYRKAGECDLTAEIFGMVAKSHVIVQGENKVGGYEYVDLGLPSGTLWATMNVGAKSPEESGNYYAWGETKTKKTYSEKTCDWCNVDYKDLQADGIIDSLGNLTSAYDAATVNWGKDWRMPTRSEIKELLNLDYAYTKVNGVNGMKFTGSNGNTLFLPFAGDCYGGGFLGAGKLGDYWSATAHEYDWGAYHLYLYSEGAYWGDNGRDNGQSIRPVLRK